MVGRSKSLNLHLLKVVSAENLHDLSMSLVYNLSRFMRLNFNDKKIAGLSAKKLLTNMEIKKLKSSTHCIEHSIHPWQVETVTNLLEILHRKIKYTKCIQLHPASANTSAIALEKKNTKHVNEKKKCYVTSAFTFRGRDDGCMQHKFISTDEILSLVHHFFSSPSQLLFFVH